MTGRTRRLLAAALWLAACCCAWGQDEQEAQVRLGGYIIGQASWCGQADKEVNTDMQLRLVRLYADGQWRKWQYKLQVQANGVGRDTKENSPRIVDAWAEWQPIDEVRVKFGQMKRPFTFENPMHPWLLGNGTYSQLSTRLAGFSDRVGEHASNGRDMGLQLQGDLLPLAVSGRRLLHYQVGLFTGQGINHADRNNHKDLIGGLSVRPLKGWEAGLSGWKGDYVQDGLTVDRNRWAAGLRYERAWSLRAEYAHSHGYKVGTDLQGHAVATGSHRADAWYVVAGVPVGGAQKLWGHYDVYRDTGEWGSTRSIYGLTLDWNLNKNLKLQANVNYLHDRTANASGQDGDYGQADVQLYVRF